MPIPNINYKEFGSGGSALTPNNSAGRPWLGQILEAQREDAFLPRFDWDAAVSAPVASDLATLVALENEFSAALVQAAPAGAAAFGVRASNAAFTAGVASEEAAALEHAIRGANALKAAFVATASTDYTSNIGAAAAATDQATAITLVNTIRTALSIT